MADRYATVDEVKAILKLTGTDNDLLIDSLLDAASELLHSLVGVDSFLLTQYTDEPVKGSGDFWLMVKNKPLVAITAISDDMDNDVTYTIRRYKNRQAYFESKFPKLTYLVSYTAGYRVNDTLELILDDGDLANLNNKTISVATLYAATATYTLKTTLTVPAVATEIEIGATAVETAANIAAVIDGATNDGDEIVTFGTDQDISTTILTADGTLTLKNIPKTIKVVVAYLLGGLMTDTNTNPGIQSYSIGQKSVTFRTSQEGSTAIQIIKSWLPNLQKASVFS